MPTNMDIRSFNAMELQHSVLHALKLRENWSRKSPIIRRVGVIKADASRGHGAFDLLRLLNDGSVLLGIKRSRHAQRPTMTVSVFTRLDTEFPHLTIQFSVPGIPVNEIDACLINNDQTLALAVTMTKGNKESVTVCQYEAERGTNHIFVASYKFSQAICLWRLQTRIFTCLTLTLIEKGVS